jgi:apolipoprotein N-acyltransferase
MNITNSENLEENSEMPSEKIPVKKDLSDFTRSLILAVLSGILSVLAFPDHDIWYLTFICWVPLLLAIKDKTPKKSFLYGTVTGFTFNALGSYWLYNTINYFGNFPAALSLLFMVILCAFQGARIGFLAWLFSRSVKNGWPLPVSFILAFSATEFLYPVLFPWHNATHVHTVPLLMQLADIGGVILIGVFLSFSSLAIAEIFWSVKEKRKANKFLVSSGIIAPLIMVGYGTYRISYIDSILDTFQTGKVGIVQGNRPMIGDDAAESLRAFRKTSSNLELQEKLDFIIWPEGGLSFGLREKEVSNVFKQIVFNENSNYGMFKLHTPIITGGFIINGEDKDKKIFNTSFLVEPDGRIGGIYDKYFLIPFGEYIPFGDVFPFLYTLSPNTMKLTPGTELSTFKLKNHTIVPLICYEDIKPSFANNAITVGDPDLLVSFANDGWFGKSTVPNIHFALSKFRAVEHRRYLVRATNTGISGFVDPTGRIYDTTEPVIAQEKIGEIRYMKMHTIFEILGDYPYWLASMAIVLMAFFRKKTGNNINPG